MEGVSCFGHSFPGIDHGHSLFPLTREMIKKVYFLEHLLIFSFLDSIEGPFMAQAAETVI